MTEEEREEERREKKTQPQLITANMEFTRYPVS